MKRQFYIFVSLLALVMTACGGGSSSDDDTTPTPTPSGEKTQIKVAVRISDGSFEDGGNIGLYVVNYKNGSASSLLASGNYVDNAKFTYNSGTWTGNAIYWNTDGSKADLYGYYPYSSMSNATAYTFSVKSDQTTSANYKASDFLWGKLSGQTPTSSTVNITLNHLMSKAIINVRAGDGFTDEELASSAMSVKLNGLKTQAQINLGDGSVSATGSGSAQTAYNTASCQYRALVVPQTVAGSGLLTITMNDIDYVFNESVTFESNKEYTFNVTLSKSSNGINVSIGSWEDSGEDFGGTVN